jgi:general nucleoside transport system ATP-binding protein
VTDLVILTGIDKRFGTLQALANVSITLRRGRVAAIVGENGAGKSTLAKIIAGILPRDAGDLVIDGVPVRSWSRRQAIAAGIGFVPQALSFVPTLSIVENHLLAGKGLRLDRRKARLELEAAAAEMDVDLDFGIPVERLSLAERQLGEIVAALAAGARILLLDEPTSALGPMEVDRLTRTLRRLAAAGTTIGLVTHRIAEVMDGADAITVLRGGKVVLDGETAGLDPDAIARLMVGERDRSKPVLASVTTDWTRLVVKDIAIRDADQTLLDNVSFSIRQGEILAVAGVSGASQPALAEAVAGLRPLSSGRIEVDGVDISGDPFRAIKAGLAFVPENRAEGIVGSLTVAENASLLPPVDDGFRTFGLRRPDAERAAGNRVIADFDVRPPDPRATGAALSGGNQQKLLVGRELARQPGVIVAHGPTQGLDLAAASTIRAALAEAAARGAAILVISADLDELLELGHRMIVLTNGRVAAEFDLSEDIDLTALGQAMTGLNALEPAS